MELHPFPCGGSRDQAARGLPEGRFGVFRHLCNTGWRVSRGEGPLFPEAGDEEGPRASDGGSQPGPADRDRRRVLRSFRKGSEEHYQSGDGHTSRQCDERGRFRLRDTASSSGELSSYGSD